MISKQKLEVFKMIILTHEDVRKIFLLRSKGEIQIDIGKKMGCSDSHISQILLRRIHGDVEIDTDILEKISQLPRTRKPHKKKKSTSIPLHELVAAYTAACHRLYKERAKCSEAGVSDDELDFLDEIIKSKG